MTNTYGAHATFSSTVSNAKLGEEIYETNLFDVATKFVMDARFLSLSDAMIAFSKSIIEERWDPNMLILHEDPKTRLDALAQRWKILQKATLTEREHRTLKQNGKDRNQPCWCGSEFKQKKCHG